MTGNDRTPDWQGDDSFGPGWGNQTSIATDGGQFARLSAQYLARGGAALK